MIQLVFLVLKSCPKHLKLLYDRGARFVLREELESVGHQEFDLKKSQVLLLFPIVLKPLPLP